MITPAMYVTMVTDILNHAGKHLAECRELLAEISAEGTSLETKLQDIESLKLHLGIVQGDAGRALNLLGD